jgi:hypothetical protein
MTKLRKPRTIRKSRRILKNKTRYSKNKSTKKQLYPLIKGGTEIEEWGEKLPDPKSNSWTCKIGEDGIIRFIYDGGKSYTLGEIITHYGDDKASELQSHFQKVEQRWWRRELMYSDTPHDKIEARLNCKTEPPSRTQQQELIDMKNSLNGLDSGAYQRPSHANFQTLKSRQQAWQKDPKFLLSQPFRKWYLSRPGTTQDSRYTATPKTYWASKYSK